MVFCLFSVRLFPLRLCVRLILLYTLVIYYKRFIVWLRIIMIIIRETVESQSRGSCNRCLMLSSLQVDTTESEAWPVRRQILPSLLAITIIATVPNTIQSLRAKRLLRYLAVHARAAAPLVSVLFAVRFGVCRFAGVIRLIKTYSASTSVLLNWLKSCCFVLLLPPSTRLCFAAFSYSFLSIYVQNVTWSYARIYDMSSRGWSLPTHKEDPPRAASIIL